jgi:hypothetical protein
LMQLHMLCTSLRMTVSIVASRGRETRISATGSSTVSETEICAYQTEELSLLLLFLRFCSFVTQLRTNDMGHMADACFFARKKKGLNSQEG